MRLLYLFFVAALLIIEACQPVKKKKQENIKLPQKAQEILDYTQPLKYSRGNRLPLYIWPATNIGNTNDTVAEAIVKKFNERGIGVVCSWSKSKKEEQIQKDFAIAKAQKKLGLKVNISITSLLSSFYTGEKKQAHIDKNGNPFFDNSFGGVKTMGCPFTLDSSKKVIRDRVEYFLKRYQEEKLPVDFIFADWEIDGPIEVNGAYDSSLKCVRCQKYLGKNFGFDKFQKTMRDMRSHLQLYAYSLPVLSYYPNVLIGNYAVYPNDGYRYWYDYFEYLNKNQPIKKEQKAEYRKWYNDFPLTGYTCAMPVMYPWSNIYLWYNFKNPDYRWFYNMLLVASNAGESTPHNIPIIGFVHYHTVFIGPKSKVEIKQMSSMAYKEALWHMLLRGTDTFFMWCSNKDNKVECQLVQEVYAAAQEYGKYLENGVPFTFDVPKKEGPVISGLVLNDSVLIRRTDFNNNHEPVTVMVGTKQVIVKYAPGECHIISLK